MRWEKEIIVEDSGSQHGVIRAEVLALFENLLEMQIQNPTRVKESKLWEWDWAICVLINSPLKLWIPFIQKIWNYMVESKDGKGVYLIFYKWEKNLQKKFVNILWFRITSRDVMWMGSYEFTTTGKTNWWERPV
jgi:hypothetical protein